MFIYERTFVQIGNFRLMNFQIVFYFFCTRNTYSKLLVLKAVIDIPFQISQSFDLPFLLFYFKDPWFLEYFGQDYSMEAKNTSIHSWMRLKRKWALGQPLVDSQVKFLCSVANMFLNLFTKFVIFFFISCKASYFASLISIVET